jgi:DNA-binding transcriptional MerR regulator/methylmalonyl-CoA mutase cobalamin-binding subunit
VTNELAKPDEKRHPIQVVSRRSGLSPDVLRAWEKRYQVVIPARSPGGRRLYSDADVERLRLIQEAMAGGRRIGQLAALGMAELEGLVQEDRREAVSRPEKGQERPAHSNPEVYLVECLDAVRALDDSWLKSSFGRAVIALRPGAFIDEVATPLMHQIGHMWAEGQLTPGHEHLASTVIRQTVADITNMLQPQNGAARIVIATPAHQLHEIGAMLAAATSALLGWHVTYLGGDLPAGDIARAADQSAARAIGLSITHPPDDPRVEEELKALRGATAKSMAILVGGQAAPSYRHIIDSIRAVYTEDMKALRKALDDLKQSR